MASLYRVSYSLRYLNRAQEWDFTDEVECVYASSAEAACDVVLRGNRRASSPVAVAVV